MVFAGLIQFKKYLLPACHRLRAGLFWVMVTGTIPVLNAQEQDTALVSFSFSKIPGNQQAVYKNENGKTYGCGWSLECLYPNLEITGSYYNNTRQLIELEGYYWFLQSHSQPFDFTIFLGRPAGERLTGIQQVLYVESEKTFNPGDSVPVFSNGYFKIRIKFTKQDRLYFDAGPATVLKEYDIGSLLKNEEE